MSRAAKTVKSSEPKPRLARLTLTIDGVDYSVRPVPFASLPAGCYRAVTLTRSDRKRGKVRHTIAEGINGPICSCLDQRYRRVPINDLCKHLAAAMACGLF